MAKFDDDPKMVEFALCIAYRVAQRLIRQHGKFPHHEIDDLKHHAFIGIRCAFVDGKYRKSKGAISTFMWRVAWGDLEDLREKMIRRKSRAVPDDATTDEAPSDDGMIFDDDVPLAEWLRRLYVRLEHRYAPVRYREAPRMGRPSYWRPEQRAALTLLQARTRLSVRGMVHLLASQPDLRDAMKMARIPGQTFFFEIQNSVRKVQKARQEIMLAVA